MSSRGRPPINLDAFRIQIEQWKYHDRMTADDIVRRISTEFNISTSRRVLYRYLQTWQSDQTTSNMTQARTEDTEALRNRIKELFFENVLKDKNILFQLQKEGFVVTNRGLIRIRRSLGLLRHQTPEQKEEQLIKLRHFFENDALLNTKLQSFGRTYLYTYIRQKQLSLSRQALYEAFRDFMPTNVTDRWNTMQHRRTGWTAPGPDFIWSIDAYDKLKAWGIEIYASIDAYSRYITWLKSTHNEKIESWWHRLSDGRARHWREYFGRITANGRFSADSIPDRIAILYLFMPIIRTELSEFVYIWNSHYIRKQRNRPHVLPGQPWVLYHQPEIRETRSYARPIPFDRLRPLKELFKHDNIDLDAYLPQDTITVCKKILEGQIFPQDTPENPKLSIYLYLRARLEAYILSGEQPAIGLLETPIGGINRVRSHLAAHDIDVQLLNQETQGDINWDEIDHRVES
ncbi:uncharacterized protein FFB20_14735 [Fusarium fujikuroi]|uniref:Integrase core domain-containing protein n=1 Tax=Gibberella fujikuroi (strain CBS 195.34 / IMI 58289 / NRRL A-6831) TaxID=1279085 RepID=S0DXF5_GIBF5|nr:uncharacterized protein FFUJ_14892 [Fusarium fujikuroi IMI 58289]SCN66194.1 uncharacterized protein FFB20_02077 [Fusarium fujikuroi]CCT65153.1 uncharacterized protein FFUJ_14892 [Fusarium fujikuroi IMI 58289]SCN88288.1 uncharacterized protein FFM5_04342 [Fusarium fujikuroi]SCO06615.1 uncharacterized protein FFB20_12652 [Fusarium fujikuroi]SCO15400.1 uncharacterized protein FFB20_14735 [Fusarium fujikuroi]